MSGAPGAGDTERGMASGVADTLEAVLAGHPHLRDNDQLALDIKHIRLIVALLRRLAAAPATDLAQIRRASARGLIIRELVMFESETGLMPGKMADRILDGLAVLASGRAGEDGPTGGASPPGRHG